MSDDLVARVSRRWRGRDRMLPAPRPPSPGQEVIEVPGGLGVVQRATTDPTASKPMWFAADRFWLTPLIAGPDAARAMDELLTIWRASIAGELASAGTDSAAYVTYPSREDEIFAALSRHGLVPHVIVAVRPAGRSTPAAPPTRAVVRRATADDLDTIAALTLLQFREEQRYGSAYERPDTPEQIRREPEVLLAAPDPWLWLAEQDGRAVGLVIVSPPAHNEWLDRYAGQRPLAYLSTAYVDPAVRGDGIGAALVNAAHRAVDDAGVAVTLLHHATLNPYSGPFWHRMGYRPLWTGWHARPASALR